MTIWVPDIFSRSGPRYLAIADAIAGDVATGALAGGARLPTQRDLAYRLGVTVGTVGRGYGEARRRGLIAGEVGRGTYVRGAAGGSSATVPGFDFTDLGGDTIDLRMNVPVIGEAAQHLRDVLARIAGQADLSELLSYRPRDGGARNAHSFSRWLSTLGMEAPPERIAICNGAQHALSVLAMMLARPGDLIVTETHTYPGMKNLAAALNLRLKGLSTDDHGLVPDAFERACREDAPRMLYCQPGIHNPTTAHMPEDRRRRIAAIAEAHGILVIEDDVYGFLVENPPPPIAMLAPNVGFFVTSTSKCLAPGLRVAAIAVPPAYRAEIEAGINVTGWMAPPLMPEIATRWIEDGTAAHLSNWHRAEARARNGMARRILGDRMAATHPASYHLWLPLPPEWRAEAFAARLEAQGVRVLPGEAFAPAGSPPARAIRAGLAAVDDRRQLERALNKMAELLSAGPGWSEPPGWTEPMV